MGLTSSTQRHETTQISTSLTSNRCPARERTHVSLPSKNRAGNPAPPPSGTMLLKDIQMLATLNDEYGDIADAAIYIKGNVIQWVGKTSGIPREFRIAENVVSLPDRVVIPGLVCCHHHMYQVRLQLLCSLFVIGLRYCLPYDAHHLMLSL